MGRLAVVLFNLGGPDRPEDVRPFLRNLFSDPAILRAPAPVRLAAASLIARLRAPSARANYAAMGGGSPLLGETKRQAAALESELAGRNAGETVKVFIAMRYWTPDIPETAAQVKAFAPDRLMLLPLYPQFSTTTTGSSLRLWLAAYKGSGETRVLCCWPRADGLVEGHAQAILGVWEAAGRPKVRLLFSAHGLPKSIDRDGDPYRWQVEQTCGAVAARLGEGWDWQVCYQSRVGPLKWLEPSTPEAIRLAAQDGLGVLVDPITFVSEHVETLVELDRDYADVARAVGAPTYLRAPTVGTAEPFIRGLADMVEEVLAGDVGTQDHSCPAAFRRCGRMLDLTDLRAAS